jgi:hypothetical protein
MPPPCCSCGTPAQGAGADAETVVVLHRLADRRDHRAVTGVLQHLALVQRAVPREQVVDGRHQRTGRMRLGHAEVAGARPVILVEGVTVHVARDHPLLLVAVAGVAHAQRLEEGFVQVDVPRLAAGRFDHRAQQHVAGIVVVPALAGGEVGLLGLEGVDEFRRGDVAHDRGCRS